MLIARSKLPCGWSLIFDSSLHNRHKNNNYWRSCCRTSDRTQVLKRERSSANVFLNRVKTKCWIKGELTEKTVSTQAETSRLLMSQIWEHKWKTKSVEEHKRGLSKKRQSLDHLVLAAELLIYIHIYSSSWNREVLHHGEEGLVQDKWLRYNLLLIAIWLTKSQKRGMKR